MFSRKSAQVVVGPGPRVLMVNVLLWRAKYILFNLGVRRRSHKRAARPTSESWRRLCAPMSKIASESTFEQLAVVEIAIQIERAAVSCSLPANTVARKGRAAEKGTSWGSLRYLFPFASSASPDTSYALSSAREPLVSSGSEHCSVAASAMRAQSSATAQDRCSGRSGASERAARPRRKACKTIVQMYDSIDARGLVRAQHLHRTLLVARPLACSELAAGSRDRCG